MTVGVDGFGRYLVVVFTERGSHIRLISTRVATKQERKFYEGWIPISLHAKRGAVTPAAPGKTRITIRLDNEVIDWFKRQVNKAGGGNYQSLINEALKVVR